MATKAKEASVKARASRSVKAAAVTAAPKPDNMVAAVSPVAKAAEPASFKLMDKVADIEAAIVSIHRRGQTLQHDMHIAACSVLQHLGKHGDVRLVAKLISAMPEMGRANALCDWFTEFGPVIFDEKRQAQYVKDRKVKLGEAMGKPFWKFSPELPYVPVDAVKEIDRLIKRFQKDQKEAGVNHAAIINGLERLKPTAPTAH